MTLLLSSGGGVKANDISVQVHELLRLETEHALKRYKQDKAQQGGVVVEASLPQQQPPQLVAIYGQGAHLLAEVRYRQQSLLFKQGHAAAIGRHQADAELRLQRLDSHCGQFVYQQEPLQLCMEH
ncbi:hypothetical protein [Alcaligenes endophyticus]|uniref:Uncharacterized protein n=1 Tax=Alcaligenes endophyticus TaxID=1929088 RepID=A0ABT8EIA5_9BURK|nr:hypothetical protein [Alcaligenes endophyticus]MCX5592644.1 hypothetical protein [Alcaligenes endophyticus]MDN4121008.1 hypothetical protein [Alcaligenes endophyticus]